MQVKHEGEYFQSLNLVWDVSRLWAMVEEGRDVYPCPTKTHYEGKLAQNDNGGFNLMGVSVDVDRAMSDEVDTEIPLLFIMRRLKGGKEFPFMVDGHHRLYKAYHKGIESVDAYIFSVEEAESVMTDLLD